MSFHGLYRTRRRADGHHAPAGMREVLGYLVDCQDQYKDMLVRAQPPHFKRLVYEKDPNSPLTKATGYMGGGCLAGTNYARVTPNDELTPVRICRCRPAMCARQASSICGNAPTSLIPSATRS